MQIIFYCACTQILEKIVKQKHDSVRRFWEVSYGYLGFLGRASILPPLAADMATLSDFSASISKMIDHHICTSLSGLITEHMQAILPGSTMHSKESLPIAPTVASEPQIQELPNP